MKVLLLLIASLLCYARAKDLLGLQLGGEDKIVQSVIDNPDHLDVPGGCSGGALTVTDTQTGRAVVFSGPREEYRRVMRG